MKNGEKTVQSGQYQLADLLELMRRLRDPADGCPWDRQQTFTTILPFTLEEAYEVADAIEREDHAHLKEELGDLLFQVVFHAQMGQEQGLFDFDQVVNAIVEKLLRRHPHVFPDGTLTSRPRPDAPPDEAAIKANWEAIKQAERAGKAQRPASVLDDVPQALPALSRAEKLQKRAAREGFDWDDLAPVLAKVQEELGEVQEVLAEERDPERRQARLQDEMGDVLFACVNLARFLGVDAELALRQTNRKFERRFRQIEERVRAHGQQLRDLTLADLDRIWDEVKQQEK